jgi:hypothetical protein
MTAGCGEGRESVECEGVAQCCLDINLPVSRTGLAEVTGAGCRDVEAQKYSWLDGDMHCCSTGCSTLALVPLICTG